MRKNYGVLLKKQNIVIDGKNSYILSFVSSMEYKKTNDDKFLLVDIDSNIKKTCNIKYIDEYETEYYYISTKTIKKPLEEFNNKYFGTYYQLKNGKLMQITNEDKLKEINNYLNNLTIKEAYKEIKSNIIGQDEHIRSIITSILLNINLCNTSQTLTNITKNKHNILITGDTGVGKTEIIKQIAEKLNIPIVIESTPAYSLLDNNTGLIDNMIINLIYSTDGDVNLAQKGIIAIDNFDTLFRLKEDYSHLTSEYIQKELIKLMEGDTRIYNISEQTYRFNTHGLTIILLGNFNNITNHNNIKGFNNNISNKDINKKLLDIGIKPELLDRISKIRVLNKLNKEDFINILNSKNSKLMHYLNLLKKKGLNVKISNDYINNIADQAIKNNRGVHSLNKIIDNFIDNEFSDTIFNDNNTKKKIKYKEL